MKRMLLVLSIAAVMAAMVLATTAPAFAKSVRHEALVRCVAEVQALHPEYSTAEVIKQCTPLGQA